jgi:hypothetical protein
MATERARRILDEMIAERGESYADVSRLIGRNQAYIQQFIKRGTPRRLGEQDRRVIARYFGVAEHLLGGMPVADELPTPARRPARMVDLPRLSLGASAGAGSLDQDEQIVDVVAFDRHWLRRMGFELGSITMIRVDGESMAPTLYDGDEILVDTSDTAARLRDGIYVLRLDGVLMVKRIVIGPRRGSLSILSDNPHYPDWTEIEPALVHIVGRVLWVGRALQ